MQNTMTRQEACDQDAANLQSLIDTKVPGLFKVFPNASAPLVQCQGLGGDFCGWTVSTWNAPAERAWRHFYMDH